MRLVILVRLVDPDTVRCTGVHGKMGPQARDRGS